MAGVQQISFNTWRMEYIIKFKIKVNIYLYFPKFSCLKLGKFLYLLFPSIINASSITKVIVIQKTKC